LIAFELLHKMGERPGAQCVSMILSQLPGKIVVSPPNAPGARIEEPSTSEIREVLGNESLERRGTGLRCADMKDGSLCSHGGLSYTRGLRID
jgi:hypothetical protein